jgi:putative transposase
VNEIWMAETRASAQIAFDQFLASYGVKYPKATEYLVKDREALLALYELPAEHWIHIRSLNVIEPSVVGGGYAGSNRLQKLSRE